MKSLSLGFALLITGAVAGIVIGVYRGGETSGKAICEAGQAKANEAPRARQKVAAQAAVNRAGATGAQHERNRTALDDFFNHLEKEQAHAPADPVDSCVLPPDRLQRWADANAGRADQGSAISEPDHSAQAAAATGVRADAGLGIKPPRGGEGLPPVGGPGLRPAGFSGDQP